MINTLIIKMKSFILNFFFCFKLLYRSSKKTIIFILFTNSFISILSFSNLYLAKYLIDNLLALLSKNGKIDDVMKNIVFLLITFAVTKIIISFLQSYIQKLNDLQMQHLLTYINVEMMKKSVSVDISYFDTPKSFDELNKSRQNAHSLHQMVFATTNTITNLFFFIINAVLALSISWLISILVFLCILPKYLFKYKVEKKNYQFEKQQYRKTRFAGYLNSLLFDKHAAKEIRIFNVGNYIINWYASTQRELTEEQDRFSNKVNFKIIIVGLPSIILQIMIKIYVAYRILLKLFTLGDFTFISGIFEKLDSSITSIIDSISTYVGYNDRINDFKYYFMHRKSLVISGERRIDNIENIEFRNVSFSYPDSDVVLRNISFNLVKNEKNMIVGLNGSGKTTIIKLITRFYEPTDGEIYINSIPVKEYDIESLRSNIATVFQDYNIFSFTIRENISIGDFSKLEDDLLLRQALNFSNFNNEEYRKEENLDLIINKNFEEEGIELSGGQRQKLAISRAVVRDSGLIILDEPTSSLDPISESEILDAFNKLYINKTLLMISHRLSAAIKMDKIIFIDLGEIIGIGSHNQLYANNEKYRKLFNLQADKYR